MVNWDELCSVKVARFDDGHKQLFSIANRLHTAMLTGEGALSAPKIVQELVDHARGHFAAEEAAMEKTNYPELASHRRQHEEILEKLEQFQQEVAAGEAVSSVMVAEFIDERLMLHTRETDQKYSEHLNANGIF